LLIHSIRCLGDFLNLRPDHFAAAASSAPAATSASGANVKLLPPSEQQQQQQQQQRNQNELLLLFDAAFDRGGLVAVEPADRKSYAKALTALVANKDAKILLVTKWLCVCVCVLTWVCCVKSRGACWCVGVWRLLVLVCGALFAMLINAKGMYVSCHIVAVFAYFFFFMKTSVRYVFSTPTDAVCRSVLACLSVATSTRWQ
jgi:hypothetical protein